MAAPMIAVPGGDDTVDGVRRRILLAGRAAFASVGYEGARLRAIATAAGVQHTLLLYHFKTKDALWHAVMGDLLTEFEAALGARLHALDGAAAGVVARALVRDFVHFCARHPELHRIMTIEGHNESDRLAWLVGRYSRPAFARVGAALATFAAPPGDTPIQWYYAIIGLAASPFTLAPEYRQLAGTDPFAPEAIERHARFVTRLVFGDDGPD